MYLIVRFIIFLVAVLISQTGVFSQSASKVNVQIVSDEAEAVLNILDKRADKEKISATDWQRIFKSEGYIRLKKRKF